MKVSKYKKRKQAGEAESRVRKADVATIVEDEFENYLIRAGRLSGNFIARAFPKANSKSQGLIAEASGTSEADAIEALKETLRTRGAQRTKARRRDERSGASIPSKEEFVEALRQTRFTDAQMAMLKAHAISGEDGMTLAALTRAAGYKSPDTAMKALKRAGSLVGDYLGADTRSSDQSDQYDERDVLGYCIESDADVSPVWVMHEELRQAVYSTN